MPLFEIPIRRRVVNVARNATCFYRKVEIMHVDEMGIYLCFNEETEQDVSFIRRHLVGVEGGKCIIEAGSPHRAIKRFYIKYEGARIGGQQRKAKALWIDEERYIFQLPHCELLHRNRSGEFICGRPSKEGDGNQGEWGMCVLEGYNSSESCPISEFHCNWRQKSVPFVMVDGFKVVESLSY